MGEMNRFAFLIVRMILLPVAWLVEEGRVWIRKRGK